MNLSPYRPIIPSIPAGIYRPLWSVMIPTYNCANYLRETLRSVLAQAPEPELMQIEVVDDCSTKDNPAEVVEEVGKGRVSFYRQPQNRGHVGNFQTCFERSRGHLIHLLHGDDYVHPGFYSKLQAAFNLNPEIGAAFCRYQYVDEYGQPGSLSDLERSESGILESWVERIAIRQRIQWPSIVVRRSVYEMLGGFDSRVGKIEDWEMWVRIAVHYPVWFETETLACYRVHSSSVSGQTLRTGSFIQDCRRALAVIKEDLPPEIWNKICREAYEDRAFFALISAERLMSKGDLSATMNLFREALRCSTTLPVLRWSTKILLQLFYQLLVSTVGGGHKNGLSKT